MIHGQASFPVEHYLQVWRDTATRILAVEAALGLLLAFLAWPMVQHGVDRVLRRGAAPAGTAVTTRMSRGQVIAGQLRHPHPPRNADPRHRDAAGRLAFQQLPHVRKPANRALFVDPSVRRGRDRGIRHRSRAPAPALGFGEDQLFVRRHGAEPARPVHVRSPGPRKPLWTLRSGQASGGGTKRATARALRVYREQWRVEPGLAAGPPRRSGGQSMAWHCELRHPAGASARWLGTRWEPGFSGRYVAIVELRLLPAAVYGFVCLLPGASADGCVPAGPRSPTYSGPRLPSFASCICRCCPPRPSSRLSGPGAVSLGAFPDRPLHSLEPLVAFVLGFYLLGLRHNFGKVNHNDAIVVLGLAIFTFAPSGDAWSLDALGVPTGLVRRRTGPARQYSWPIELYRLMLALVLFSAGVAKARGPGLMAWVLSKTTSTTPSSRNHSRTLRRPASACSSSDSPGSARSWPAARSCWSCRRRSLSSFPSRSEPCSRRAWWRCSWASGS